MMLNWKSYHGHVGDIRGKRKFFDNTIYTFDIETTSFIILDGKQHHTIDYMSFSEDERKRCEFRTTMYIWMFSINEQVYYGRTWDELKHFMYKVNSSVGDHKIVFIHNQAFEFQFLKSVFKFDGVLARKAHKVMVSFIADEGLDFELRCSAFMSNVKLAKLSEVYNLPIEKAVGDLDYSVLRHSKTPLTEKEMGYCERDCLVVYEYIKFELKTYETVNRIPKTSTGHVRGELKELIRPDYKYRNTVRKAINTDPHVYNLLVEAFMGGYTHSNYVYTDEVLHNVTSFDETSAYPYVMVTHKFPSSEFRKASVKSISDMSERLAYIVVVKFHNIESKYFNSFISKSKCRNIHNADYDNGRVMRADELEMTLTDVDFRFILDSHNIKSYEILESYCASYNYLPKKYINFILDKYVAKTQYKNVPGKEIEYQLEKGKFNALYGMSVTNNIRDEVIYDNIKGWEEVPLTNDEIVEALEREKKDGFLSFSYGVWVTAWARNNLLRRVMALDQYVVYCDTDSIKLLPGFDEKVIPSYNKTVINRIKFIAKILQIDEERFHPKDTKGIEHWLGIFDDDGFYQEFITQGAKKYAVKQDGEIKITVAGVPKEGAKALKKLDDFRDDFVFRFEDTNKLLHSYCENQKPFELEDDFGNKFTVTDKSGVCLIPTTYVLSKAFEYAELVSDASSERAIYKE